MEKKWNETIASQCRYGDIAGKVWGNWTIIWEDSEEDYQGHASILAKKGNKYCFYEWWYGSCSGCDGWEADGLSDTAIETEMRNTALWLDSKQELKKWLNMLTGKDPRSNVSMKRGGALAYGIDMLRGGIVDRINAIRQELGMKPLTIKNGKEY